MTHAAPSLKLENEIPTAQIESVGDFINQVALIPEEWRKDARDRSDPSEDPFPGESVPWFRGCLNKDHVLEPTLLRSNDSVLSKYNRNRDTLLSLEDYILSRFRSAGQRLVDIPP